MKTYEAIKIQSGDIYAFSRDILFNFLDTINYDEFIVEIILKKNNGYWVKIKSK